MCGEGGGMWKGVLTYMCVWRGGGLGACVCEYVKQWVGLSMYVDGISIYRKGWHVFKEGSRL